MVIAKDQSKRKKHIRIETDLIQKTLVEIKSHLILIYSMIKESFFNTRWVIQSKWILEERSMTVLSTI